MKSILLGIAGMAVAAQFAIAQPEPPVPPAPPAIANLPDIEDAVERAADAISHLHPFLADVDIQMRMSADAMSRFSEFRMPPMPPQAALSADMEHLASQLALLAQVRPGQPPQPPQPVPMPSPGKGRYNPERSSEDNLYRNGQRHLDRREYDNAAEAFDAAASKRGPKADGAHYWKAYALAKLGRRDEALAAIAELQKSHPSSRWLDDAKALAVEVRQASGQAVTPESQSDEDLKLMAINALMNTDAERALPLLEKILARGGSPKLKEKALFVLAQSRLPQAREIVIQYAKGKGNPDLQYKAVEYLGMHGGRDSVQLLGEVYSTTNDPNLKRRILNSFMVARDTERLFNAAKSEPDVDLRREAIHLLGVSKGLDQLAQLYASETNIEVREAIMHGLFVGGAHEKLIELAKNEKEPQLRRRAIHHLGTMGRSGPAAEALVSMYGTETDAKAKQQIINSLFIQGNVTKLVEIARKETDPELKREAVQKLANMRSKEATDFLLELLK